MKHLFIARWLRRFAHKLTDKQAKDMADSIMERIKKLPQQST